MERLKQQQQAFINDPSKIRLLNGCAGSRKTSTLIESAIHSVRKGINVLMLTKIGSVTREILGRICKDYGFVFIKKAGHYVSSDNGRGVISVANYDAFVDCQLRNSEIRNDGDAFNAKVKLLTAAADNTEELIMKTGELVDEIIIDEVQDLTVIQMDLIVALLQRHTDIRLTVAGDAVQTLFVESLDKDNRFALSYLDDLNASRHYLTTNFRCPKAHNDFVNITMKDAYDSQNLPLMLSCNDNMEDKPVIFLHPNTQSEVSRFYIAKQLVDIVKHVLDNDPEITPGDIVIMMNKTNANAVFEQCMCSLNHYYMDRYPGSVPYGKVQHMKTKNSEGRVALNWETAENKTSFSSVHALKGLAFKCVIILGMSEKSIPLSEWLFKPEELVSQSTFNVACSRSTKYLFIGVNGTPSRYIWHNLDELKEKQAVYLSWEPTTVENAPPFYASLLKNYKHSEPVKFINRYATEKIDTPTKSLLAVKKDVVMENHISDHISNGFAVLNSLEKIKFGERINLRKELNDDQRGIFGTMSELVLQHYVATQQKNQKLDSVVLQDYKDRSFQFKYTRNQRILALVHELNMNHFVRKTEKWFGLKVELMKMCKSKNIREWILPYNTPVYIIDEAFQNSNIGSLVTDYFTENELPSKKWWDIAVFLTSVSGDHRVLSANKLIGSFNEDISRLHSNVKLYYDGFLRPKIAVESKIEFQTDLLVKKTIDADGMLSEQLKEIGFSSENDTYTYGFYGISDLLIKNTNENLLVEIKSISASTESKLKAWCFQILLYIYLFKKQSGIEITHMEIVNLYSARIWRVKISELRIKYRDMITSIMEHNHFPKELIDNFLKR